MADGGATAGGTNTPDPERSRVEQGVGQGFDQGFEQVYRQHALAVVRSARQLSRDAHTAEDLAGEAFERTLRAMRAGGGPETSTRAYLLTVVRRLGYRWNALAGRERLFADLATVGFGEPGMAGLPPAASPEEVALHRAEQLLVAKAFLTLPERWQQVLWHTVVLGEPIVGVAAQLGLSPNATAVLAHRAREGLRRAYLRAHVRHAPEGGVDCRRYAGQLASFTRAARGDFRPLRRHLRGCARCRAIHRDLADVNAKLRSVVPVALVGWLAAARLTGVGQAGAEAAAPVAVGAAAGGAGIGMLPKVFVLTASCALATGLANGPLPAPEAGRPPLPPDTAVEERSNHGPASDVSGNPAGPDDRPGGGADLPAEATPGPFATEDCPGSENADEHRAACPDVPPEATETGSAATEEAQDDAQDDDAQDDEVAQPSEEEVTVAETPAVTSDASSDSSGNANGGENGNNGNGGENGNNGTGGENGNNGNGGENGNNGNGNGNDGANGGT